MVRVSGGFETVFLYPLAGGSISWLFIRSKGTDRNVNYYKVCSLWFGIQGSRSRSNRFQFRAEA